MCHGLQVLPPQVAVTDLAHDVEAAVVNFSQLPLLRPIPRRHCVAGALKDAAQMRRRRRRQA